MVCLCWLSAVMIAFAFFPGFGSACMDTSVCKELSNKRRILDCIHLCLSVNQTEYPELGSLALKADDASDDGGDMDGGDDEYDLLFSILLASLASEDKTLEPDPQGDGKQTERFENGLTEPASRAHGDSRRSYSMEHFRWGKPSGRPRRPVKIFASPLEGGFLPLARRQLSGQDEEETQIQVSSRAKVGAKARAQSQERKDAAYRISHFRWGSPRTSKRNAGFMKPWVKKTQGQLTKIFRNNVANDGGEHAALSS